MPRSRLSPLLLLLLGVMTMRLMSSSAPEMTLMAMISSDLFPRGVNPFSETRCWKDVETFLCINKLDADENIGRFEIIDQEGTGFATDLEAPQSQLWGFVEGVFQGLRTEVEVEHPSGITFFNLLDEEELGVATRFRFREVNGSYAFMLDDGNCGDIFFSMGPNMCTNQEEIVDSDSLVENQLILMGKSVETVSIFSSRHQEAALPIYDQVNHIQEMMSMFVSFHLAQNSDAFEYSLTLPDGVNLRKFRPQCTLIYTSSESEFQIDYEASYSLQNAKEFSCEFDQVLTDEFWQTVSAQQRANNRQIKSVVFSLNFTQLSGLSVSSWQTTVSRLEDSAGSFEPQVMVGVTVKQPGIFVTGVLNIPTVTQFCEKIVDHRCIPFDADHQFEIGQVAILRVTAQVAFYRFQLTNPSVRITDVNGEALNRSGWFDITVQTADVETEQNEVAMDMRFQFLRPLNGEFLSITVEAHSRGSNRRLLAEVSDDAANFDALTTLSGSISVEIEGIRPESVEWTVFGIAVLMVVVSLAITLKSSPKCELSDVKKELALGITLFVAAILHLSISESA